MVLAGIMKLRVQLILFLFLAGFLVSCEKQTDRKSSENREGCTFQYNPGATELKWTAFKFTEKVGVGGTFDRFSVENATKANDPFAALTGLRFNIDTSSVNSNHKERDGRIRSYFFGSMESGKMISGRIVEFEGTESGKARMEIIMNGISRVQELQYKLMNGMEVEIWGKIQVTDWKSEKSLDSLNEVCYDLHKGEDGISKLWPEVEIRAYTRLEKTCP